MGALQSAKPILPPSDESRACRRARGVSASGSDRMDRPSCRASPDDTRPLSRSQPRIALATTRPLSRSPTCSPDSPGQRRRRSESSKPGTRPPERRRSPTASYHDAETTIRQRPTRGLEPKTILVLGTGLIDWLPAYGLHPGPEPVGLQREAVDTTAVLLFVRNGAASYLREESGYEGSGGTAQLLAIRVRRLRSCTKAQEAKYARDDDKGPGSRVGNRLRTNLNGKGQDQTVEMNQSS